MRCSLYETIYSAYEFYNAKRSLCLRKCLNASWDNGIHGKNSFKEHERKLQQASSLKQNSNWRCLCAASREA
jgi:hypothetical protein